jgi:AraC family transcriptional regulator
MEVLGERPVEGRDLRDTLTYVPAGGTITGWAKPADRLNAFTVVSFDPNIMQEELQTEFRSMQPLPMIYFKDGELATTMRKIARIMSDLQRPASKIYAETLGLAAALEMSRVSADGALLPRPIARGALSKAQHDRASSYIEENLHRDLQLDELANVCGLTRFHFSRSFKTTFGEPPYQYITRKRLERAQRLLTTGTLPVSEIAIACGFNGLTQFGRCFAKAVGMSPIRFRRNTT